MKVHDEVAIVGYAGRLPGANNAESFWRLLRDNRSAVSWITPDRFPTGAYYHPSTDQPGRAYTFAAGLIDDVWGFDASAFGMSPREAEQVDPQQRHLLEITHDALAHAGIRPSTLAGSHTGVYVGASSVDYGARFFADPSAADVHMMTGNTLSIVSNRLSYSLDLHGPSFTVDTACSSSLVALSLAADAIRNGTVETAIVAGVNLLLSPFSFVGFSRASMLSPTGRCRPFDAAADGYVRAEGAIVLVLQSVAAARKARSRIHATIVGSAIGQDGRTTGLSLPSAESQRRLLEQVYGEFGVDPSDLAFVEAHGTGTQAGDPLEADALGKGLGQRRSQPLPIGSVKSNIGHLEPASGLAGVLKSILALNRGVLPGTLHQVSPNENIPLDELNLKVVGQNWSLPERRGPSLAGVNSFGFGGTNAHVILRGEDTSVSVAHPKTEAGPPPLLLSAHTAEALPELARAYLDQWPSDRRLSGDFIGAAAHLRDGLAHRLVVRGKTADETRHNLQQFANGEPSPAALSGQALGSNLPVAYIFSGNGSQWVGMGRTAWHANPRFREALKEVDGHFSRRQKESLVDLLFADDLAQKLRQATYAQPLLLALQIATVRCLEALGVAPVATMGHSVGEIAAAWCAGALSLDQAIDVVIARSRHQESVRHSGTMAALMLGERDARRFLASANVPGVDIAAINSWRSVTVSGPVKQIEMMLTAASDLRIGARRLDLDYPFHSSLVDPVRAPLLRELKGLKPLEARRRFVSTVSGTFAGREMLGAEHWWHNVREPVHFEAGLNCLLKEGLRLFVEIGPKPILSSYLRDTMREANVRGAVVESLTESLEQDDSDPIERAVSRLVLLGGQVDTQRFFGPPPVTALPLPAYPWRHAQFKVRSTAEANNTFAGPSHPLLGSRPRQDGATWFSTVDPALFPWMADHKVGGLSVFPGAGYVEVMLAAAREVHPDGALELRDFDIVRPLVFDGASSFETSVRFDRETGIAEFLSRPRTADTEWAMNARGIIGRSPAIEVQAPEKSDAMGTVVVPKAKVYDVSRGLGFDYGPTFQRIRHVSFPEPKLAVAALEPTEATALGGRVIDLTALDAAFHALFASEEAGVADMPMKRMLPVRFGRVRVFVPGATATRAIARTRRQSFTSMLVDISLLDEAGKVVAFAESVRLIEAPVGLGADPRSFTYQTTTWSLERAGKPSLAHFPQQDAAQLQDGLSDAAALSEALLLLDAGCLRATWSAFRSGPAAQNLRDMPSAPDGDADWAAHLCSALLWHLETKNLVIEQQGTPALAESCDLPSVDSLVRSLMARHPTMASEAASLSRLDDVMERVVAGDASVQAELQSSHWRQLDTASRQIALLRRAVFDELFRAIAARPAGRLLRLLLIGAEHAILAAELLHDVPGLDVVITDLDTDRLDQARATLDDDAQHIRCVPWSDLETWPGGTFDLAAAVDALSEIAASGDGLDRLRRLLRPRAPLLAGEPAPSLFWDIVRGIRPKWWARSANSSFPVGALLTAREWTDELESAGFNTVSGRPLLGDESVGVIVHGLARAPEAGTEAVSEPPVFAWEGDETANRKALQAALPNAGTMGAAAAETAATTDVVWTIDAQRAGATVPQMGALLSRLADRCRHLGANPARLWLILDFGDAATTAPLAPLASPLWCALTAAMRVAQNEYAALEIHCLGLAGSPTSTAPRRVAEELVAPTDEREIFFRGEERLVFRLTRGAAPLPAPPELSDDLALKLVPRSSSNRGALAWSTVPRAVPGPGEVEIEVVATGLNFRDVMWNLGLLPEEALEDGYAGPALGMECAGIVSAVGPETLEYEVGDRVVAFVSGGFASHVVTPAFSVSPLPGNLTFEAAATLPVAFLTAYYSLVHLAGLKEGETVLVHGGAGAVGLAALQVARFCGAKVIATAGTEEKRAMLRDLGADLVLNSRSLAFADEVAAHTKGRGVDIVLNSLAGEAMIRSLDCLRPFGRFIELGKRDFYANTHVGLRPFRRNLSYFGVDVDQLIIDHRELTQRLFSELIELFATGEFQPLPHRVFGGERLGDAFRLMQRAGHIGKIVVTPARQASEDPRATGAFPVASDGIHLVIGGTSGFGLATAEWLAARGARHLVLASRSGQLADGAGARVEALRRTGVDVRTVALDVTDAGTLQRTVKSLATRRPLKGIVHAAMVLDDRLIDGMDQEAITRVLQPKMGGGLNLEALAAELKTAGQRLDYLLLFSSATTLLGNPGQFNYVAANGFLEGLARQAQDKHGLPALAVAWGGIEDTGYLARNITANTSLKKRFASSLIASRPALDALDLAFDAAGKPATAFLSIGRIDWSMAKRELAVTRAPMFGAVIPAAGTRQTTDSAATLEKLRGMTVDQASEALLGIIVEEIARVLRLPPKEIDRHRALAEIGMDSLMMLELRTTVEESLQVDLPIMSLANGITPVDVARRIATLVVGDGPKEAMPGQLAALSASHVAADAESMDATDRQAAVRAVLDRSRNLEGL
ncbi:MAG: SDR family NAD(P)-dependent oxidoreductase [Reyranella sp.]|uniref:type I polyketide synthase n=1 Tax=Reyranella sp. TaxID=1929291 RepID=UPI0025DFDBA0|nr:type I polyketide synthase [Reyranella sp.]MBR2819936.1 SDR family NAD(P)-dependent oxidoreductase [Reyranella sp.]